jgi:hypothetical protein
MNIERENILKATLIKFCFFIKIFSLGSILNAFIDPLQTKIMKEKYFKNAPDYAVGKLVAMNKCSGSLKTKSDLKTSI